MGVHQSIDGIITREGNGEYTDNPKDSGGPTRYGISEKVARAAGFLGDMRDLPRHIAVSIYLDRYWHGPGFSTISPIHPVLAERITDFGVLAGPGTSGKQLQRALNVLNRNGRDWPDVSVDGAVGEKTKAALKALIDRRGESGKKVILGMVAALQSVYLIELAERRPKDEEFMFGWQLNRAIGAVLTH